MKKLLSGLAVAVVGLGSFGQAAMIDDAVSWLYTNGYTIFSNTRDYQPNNYMRRDEAAKFFVKVAEGLGKTDYVKSASECTFSDLKDGHADLKDIVVKSCRLGIFQGHNGKFMPTRALTNSQALAVMLRITSGYESETGVSYWADNYYTKAQSLGWLSLLPVLNTKEGLGTRGTVAQLVYNYQIYYRDFKKYENTDIGYYSFDYPPLYKYEEIYYTDERITPQYCRQVKIYDDKGTELYIGIKKPSESNIDISCISGIPAGTTTTQNLNTMYGNIKLTVITSNEETIYFTDNIINMEGYEIFIYGITPISDNQFHTLKNIISSMGFN